MCSQRNHLYYEHGDGGDHHRELETLARTRFYSTVGISSSSISMLITLKYVIRYYKSLTYTCNLITRERERQTQQRLLQRADLNALQWISTFSIKRKI